MVGGERLVKPFIVTFHLTRNNASVISRKVVVFSLGLDVCNLDLLLVNHGCSREEL